MALLDVWLMHKGHNVEHFSGDLLAPLVVGSGFTRRTIRDLGVIVWNCNSQIASRSCWTRFVGVRAEGEMLHPTSNRRVFPKFLGAEIPKMNEGQDNRQVLAEWVASHENGAFAKNISNIIWAHFFGVGIVDPVDDMRVSNPPSNPELLDHLAKRLVHHQFSLEGIVREICTSRTYQLATQRNASNQWDEREFSHQKIRRMRAAVLLDCITQATETTDRLPGLPAGSRAVQVADGLAAHYFLTTFGRSNRATPCTFEVKTSPTLSQALHLLNGETTGGKVSDGSFVPRMLEGGNFGRRCRQGHLCSLLDSRTYRSRAQIRPRKTGVLQRIS
ncbi:MAG: DUF1553 domain-containing protein [Pirellula staleyi]